MPGGGTQKGDSGPVAPGWPVAEGSRTDREVMVFRPSITAQGCTHELAKKE